MVIYYTIKMFRWIDRVCNALEQYWHWVSWIKVMRIRSWCIL